MKKSQASRTRKLLKTLAHEKTPLSAESFDAVLWACAESRKLWAAVDVYQCMIRDYGLVPTRKVRLIPSLS